MITTSGRSIVLTIEDATMAGEARRAASALAMALGFSEVECGRVAIVATEVASNLHKHAPGGEIIIQGMECGSLSGIDILALDRGPGMQDVSRCVTDGFSTAGSAGTGLGAMARLSAEFDIHSMPSIGTTILARFWSALQPDSALINMELGAVSLPLAGEEVCGDHWAVEAIGDQIVVLVVDGLGHGPQAAEAARQAVQAFSVNSSLPPAEIIIALHQAMRSTRGAAVAVARIDFKSGQVRFAGVGNVAGVIFNPAEDRRTSMVSHNGTVGHTIRKVQEFEYRWTRESLLIMHSDGLGSQWQLSRYPGIVSKHPGLIAGRLYNDFKRGRDDVSVVVLREGRASAR